MSVSCVCGQDVQTHDAKMSSLPLASSRALPGQREDAGCGARGSGAGRGNERRLARSCLATRMRRPGARGMTA